ncbi:MAG: M23 family metallopeptidase [Candidatus Hydrogenedentota bacterium]|nr:MAG: M23 family metallopeptidase [Candidatus Hydrogenedentota bacterium]
MQKKWNVMIVPNSPGGRVYTFNFSLRSLWTAATAAASLFVLALATVLYTGHNWQQAKLTQISHLQSQISVRDAELSQLNREFTMLEELEDKLRTIAGLRPREPSELESPAGGQGGHEWGLPDDESFTAPSAVAVSEPPVQRSVEELLEGSLEIKDSFAEVLDVFERETARLSSTPSINPVASQDAWISSGFGYRKDPISGQRRFHEGSDIVAPRGTPVMAPAEGIVTFAGWREGLGRTIVIEHGYGYTTIYGHNGKLFVKKGDLVKRGDVIANVGSSGRSTGPHLHYEIRLNGRLVNPYRYLVQ